MGSPIPAPTLVAMNDSRAGHHFMTAAHLVLEVFDILAIRAYERFHHGGVAFHEEGVSGLKYLAPHVTLYPERDRLLGRNPAPSLAHRAHVGDGLGNRFPGSLPRQLDEAK